MPQRLLLVFIIATATLAQNLVFSDDFDEFDLRFALIRANINPIACGNMRSPWVVVGKYPTL